MSQVRRTATALRVVAVLAVAVTGLAVSESPLYAVADPTLSAAPSLSNIDPDQEYVGPNTISLTAVRNETESFQVIVQAPTGTPVPAVDADVTIAGGLEARLSRVGYYTITGEPSDCEGYVTCPTPLSPEEWGDALIPETDQAWNESRDAFLGLNVPAGRNQAIWIDVFVPPGTPAASHSGSVSVTSNGVGIGQVDFTVQVLDHTIPDTSTLPMFFGSSGINELCQVHFASNCIGTSEDHWKMISLYSRAGLDHRVSISFPWGWQAPQWAATNPAYFAAYNRPLLTGSSTYPPSADWNLAAPQLTTAGLYVYGSKSVQTTPQCNALCVSSWLADAQANGYEDRVLFYACDEPGVVQAQWDNCSHGVDQILAEVPVNDPSQFFVTASLEEREAISLADPGSMPEPDILIPNIRNVDGDYPSNGNSPGDHSGDYTNHEMWIYVACDTEGCFDLVSNAPDKHDGWPGFAIDAPAAQHRSLPWMAYMYGARGILYWGFGEKLSTAWTNQDGGGAGHHGDGTLFYPGLGNSNAACPGHAACIGGTNDTALPSIRLKRLRDGLEDYELMRWLDEERGRGDEVRAIVDNRADPGVTGVFDRMDDVTPDKDGNGPGTVQDGRDRILALVEEELAPPVPEIAFMSDADGDSDIWVMNANGTNPVNLTAGPDWDGSSEQFPDWSRDGTKVAFSSDRAGDDDIWVMNADGSDPVNLTAGSAVDEAKPAWGPSAGPYAGIFYARTVDGDTDLWSMNTDGTNKAARFTGAGDQFDVTISGYNDSLVYSDDRSAGYTDVDLWFESTFAGSTWYLDDAGVNDTPELAPSVSDALVFSQVCAGCSTYDLAVDQSVAGGPGPANITNSPATNDFHGSWSPDGRIAFVSNSADHSLGTTGTDYEVWAIGSDGLSPVQLTDNTSREDHPDWRPVIPSGLVCNGLAVTVDLALGDVPTEGSDVILGTNGPDTIDGLGGDDTICGLDGDDVLAGGLGDDTILGDAGDDTLKGQQDNDTLMGGTGNDLILGNAGDDAGFGEAGIDDLKGGSGVDILDGGADDDEVRGGSGDDTLTGGVGNDVLNGGQNFDTVSGGIGDDTVNGAGSSDPSLNGDEGNDLVRGGNGGDTANGGPGDDLVLGVLGADTLNGGPGNDDLRGGDGTDDVNGDEGDDDLSGGNGTDDCDGGTGGQTTGDQHLGGCETITNIP